MKKTLALLLTLCMVFALCTFSAFAEEAKVEWPTKTIEMVVPANAGGTNDVHGRVVAAWLQEKLGIPVTVVNMGEGGGVVGYEYVRNATPDGSTIMFWYTTGIAAFYNAGTYDHAPEEFTCVDVLENQGNYAIIAGPDFPFDTFGEYVADLKATGKTGYNGTHIGSGNHMIAVAFAKAEGINLENIEATTAVDKVTAVHNGSADFAIVGAGVAAPYAASGDVKILGIMADERDPFYPEYSTIKEQGITTFESTTYSLIYAPTGMDAALVEKLNSVLNEMGEDEALVAQMEGIGSFFTDKSLCSVEAAAEFAKVSDAVNEEVCKAAGYFAR